MLSEKTVSLPIEQAYAELKTILVKNKCKIIEEKPFEYITAIQGSLNGFTPKNSKKTIKFTLSAKDSETKITSSTKITSDWTNITIIGNILATVLATMFVWIALDIRSYLETAKAGVWGWLAQAYGYPDPTATMLMVNVTLGLAVFLVAAVVAEIGVVLYVYPRKEEFAVKMLLELK
jgi:hypothetical protein